MNLFRDLFEGIASGVASAISGGEPVNPAAAAVETCCRQLGWSIDERPNAEEMVLYFNDPIVRRRRMRVCINGQGVYAAFWVYSAAWMPAKQVPIEVLGYLLERNVNLFVGWELCAGNDGDVGFALGYCALTAGLSPVILKLICDTLVKEAHEFDARMDKAGLLR